MCVRTPDSFPSLSSSRYIARLRRLKVDAESKVSAFKHEPEDVLSAEQVGFFDPASTSFGDAADLKPVEGSLVENSEFDGRLEGDGAGGCRRSASANAGGGGEVEQHLHFFPNYVSSGFGDAFLGM